MSNISSTCMAHPASEDVSDDIDKYDNIVNPPTKKDIISRVKKPSFGGTVSDKIQKLQKLLPHQAQSLKMIKELLPNKADNFEKAISSKGFPKKKLRLI